MEKEGKEKRVKRIKGFQNRHRRDSLDLCSRVPSVCVCVCVPIHVQCVPYIYMYIFGILQYSYVRGLKRRLLCSTRFAHLNGGPIWPPVLLSCVHTYTPAQIRPSPLPLSLPYGTALSARFTFSPPLVFVAFAASAAADKYRGDAEGLANYHHLGVFFFFFFSVCYLLKLPASRADSGLTICYDLCAPAFIRWLHPPPVSL